MHRAGVLRSKNTAPNLLNADAAQDFRRLRSWRLRGAQVAYR